MDKKVKELEKALEKQGKSIYFLIKSLDKLCDAMKTSNNNNIETLRILKEISIMLKEQECI